VSLARVTNGVSRYLHDMRCPRSWLSPLDEKAICMQVLYLPSWDYAWPLGPPLQPLLAISHLGRHHDTEEVTGSIPVPPTSSTSIVRNYRR